MRVVIIALVVILLGLAALSVGLTLFVFYIPQKKRMPDDKVRDSRIPAHLCQHMNDTYRKMDEIPHEIIELTSYDGYKLVGHYYELGGAGAPIVIGVHGYHGVYKFDGVGSFNYAIDYKKNILLIDQRAHGKSGSHFTCFGLKERYDCKQWVDYVLERFGQQQDIYLLGVSMGAATVTMTTALNLPYQVKAVIADCGYTSPEAIIKNTGKSMGICTAVAYPFVYAGAWLLAKIKLDEATSIEAVKRLKLPILFIHGQKDDFVPLEMARELYETCGSSKKQLYVAPDAYHAMSGIVDTKKYGKVIDEFISSL